MPDRAPAVARMQSGPGRLDQVRVLAGLARFVGAGYLAFAVLFAGQIWAMGRFGIGPALATLALILGPGFALRVSAAVTGGYRAIPLLSILCAAGFVAGVAVWLMTVRGVADPPALTLLIGIGAMPALALAQWRPFREALAVLVLCQLLAAYAVDRGEHDGVGSMLIDAAFTVVFAGVFVMVTRQVVLAGRVIDASAQAVIGEATETARRLEFARVNALIHDRVLATLLAVGPGPADDRLAAQAREALDELALLESGATAETFTGEELLTQLRTAVRIAGADVPILVDPDGGGDRQARYPVEVCTALCAAVGEAVRNSLRHAGPLAECAVLVQLRPRGLALTVVDDGAGFDPGAVPADRLGVQYSIRERVEALPGGGARIVSEPGRGTTVFLSWEDQP